MKVIHQILTTYGWRTISRRAKHVTCNGKTINGFTKIFKDEWLLSRPPSRLFSSATDRINDSYYDPYKILELEPGASAKDIRNAYINLSKQFHPDNNPADEKAKEQFILLNNAYRKIMETFEKMEDGERDTDIREDGMRKSYDFTISPLGIETEDLSKKSSTDWMKFKKYLFLFVSGFLFIHYLKDPLFQQIKHFYQSKYGPTRNEQRHQVKEKLRQAIIEKAKEEEEYRKIMHKGQSVPRIK